MDSYTQEPSVVGRRRVGVGWARGAVTCDYSRLRGVRRLSQSSSSLLASFRSAVSKPSVNEA